MPRQSQTTSTRPPARRALLLSLPALDADDERTEGSALELARLVRGLGYEVVERITQRRDGRDLMPGPGKLLQLAKLTGGSGVVFRGPRARKEDATEEVEVEPAPEPIADMVVVDAELSPGQQRHLEHALGCPVYDRPGVILEVFDRRARTRIAKLEVELARLAYETPRARDQVIDDDREGGGGRGERGHSNVELAKRRGHARAAALRRELEAAHRVRDRSRERRHHEPTVALVGYTNAGKSSLMRALTGSEVLVDDLLFATLDTTVRVIPGTTPRVLLSDTVGLIEDLPHGLIASFRSTLDEARDADLLIEVLDASDPRAPVHHEVTATMLREIEADALPRRLLLNKIDAVSEERRAELAEMFPEAEMISAHDPADAQRVRERIVADLQASMVQTELLVPYTAGPWLDRVHRTAHVVSQRFDEDGVRVTLRAQRETIEWLRNGLSDAATG